MSHVVSLELAAADDQAAPSAWLPGALTALVILGALYACSPNFRTSAAPAAGPYGGDFVQEWLGGFIIRGGDRARFYDVEYAKSLQHDPQLVGFEWDRERYLPMVYPPFYYLLVSPFSLMPVTIAVWLWALAMVACLGITWLLLVRAVMLEAGPTTVSAESPSVGSTGSRHQLARILPWTLPLAVIYQPMLETLSSSQKGTVCLLILSVCYLLMQRGRLFTAGVVFGMLAFKPQLTLVIALTMLLKRQWYFVAGGLLCGTLLLGLSVLVGGDVCWQYVQFSRDAAEYAQTAGYELSSSPCLTGFFSLLWQPGTTATRTAIILASLAVLAMLWPLLRGRLDTASPRFAVQYAGLIVATLLLSPHLFSYDLVLLLLPFWLLGVQLTRSKCIPQETRPWLIATLAGLYIIPGLAPALARVTGLQFVTLLMLSLLVILTRISRGMWGNPTAQPAKFHKPH